MITDPEHNVPGPPPPGPPLAPALGQCPDLPLCPAGGAGVCLLLLGVSGIRQFWKGIIRNLWIIVILWIIIIFWLILFYLDYYCFTLDYYFFYGIIIILWKGIYFLAFRASGTFGKVI